VIDGANRLWILDTGRTAISDGTILPASPGGAKLVGIDLETDEIFTTIVFDSKAAPAASVRLHAYLTCGDVASAIANQM
jgi:hypothetical protein